MASAGEFSRPYSRQGVMQFLASFNVLPFRRFYIYHLRYSSLMKKAEDIQKQLKGLFDSQNLAVLATHNKEQPYASLVAFVATEDLKHIYFVTPKTTRKFANLTADGRVAVLINSSANQSSDFHRAISVTAVGDAREISGPEREAMLRPYLEKHPHLEEFAKAPTCALVQITARSYYMVKNFQKVLEFHLVK
jgi:nitroimidazol reductase NimA-like FMN-containing flavoprotein (pyridoxamine 5'-phosphate oxidase superfamily)